MNFIQVSCLTAQAQCFTNWGDCRRSGAVIYSYSKDSGFAVKWDGEFQTRSVEGAPFGNIRYTKGVPSLSKILYKRVRSRASPYKTFLSTPPGLRT